MAKDNLKRYKKIKKENNQKISDNKFHVKLEIQDVSVGSKSVINK